MGEGLNRARSGQRLSALRLTLKRTPFGDGRHDLQLLAQGQEDLGHELSHGRSDFAPLLPKEFVFTLQPTDLLNEASGGMLSRLGPQLPVLGLLKELRKDSKKDLAFLDPLGHLLVSVWGRCLSDS